MPFVSVTGTAEALRCRSSDVWTVAQATARSHDRHPCRPIVYASLSRRPDYESAHPTDHPTEPTVGTARLPRRPAFGCCGSGDPDAVFLHELAVELDAPTETEVLDDVPVDRRDVRAADGVETGAEREVDGSVHLFVEVDIPHVA